MVAVIKTGHSILRILNYNENKVREGVARCIGESNYPIEAEHLTFSMKHNLLQRRLELNTNVSRNSVHISLNFDPSENGIEDSTLLEIAKDYMLKIGFAEQPYLVYRHLDAGHPHIHIVSIKVRPDGSRIDMHNIGKNQSETARKEIEKAFGLVMAEGRNETPNYLLHPVKVHYGKAESKKAVSTVLRNVIENYLFTSIPELNAILEQYNVQATRGAKESRIYQSGGLVYRILDDSGKPVGVPIKASDFYFRPTLKILEEKFKMNEVKRMVYRNSLKSALDQSLASAPFTLETLIEQLGKKGIHVRLRSNEQGAVYGITYVDHRNKCVFNGSALGKNYSAKAVLEKCLSKGNSDKDTPRLNSYMGFQPRGAAAQTGLSEESTKVTRNHPDDHLTEILFRPENTPEYISGHLKKKKRKVIRKS